MKTMLETIINYVKGITNNNEITVDSELLESGLLDSLGIVSLITEIEKEYNVDLADADFDIENFNTSKNIVEMLVKRINS